MIVPMLLHNLCPPTHTVYMKTDNIAANTYLGRIALVRPVPEAIRNPIAIKLPVSGLLARHICVMYICFLHLDRFCIYIYFWVPC